MLKIALLAAGFLALCTSTAACDDVPSPARSAGPNAPAASSAPDIAAESGAELAADDPRRAEVQAAVDARVTRDLGVPAKVDIEILRGETPWAFVSGTALDPSGGEIDFSVTKMAEASSEGMMDGANVIALLRKAPAGGWAVVEIHIGPTDVPQVGWPEQYHVSPALVGEEAAEGSQ